MPEFPFDLQSAGIDYQFWILVGALFMALLSLILPVKRRDTSSPVAPSRDTSKTRRQG